MPATRHSENEPRSNTVDSMTENPPEWFTSALADTPSHHDISVDGRNVHYRAWGEAANPLIVLVHGGAANSSWWDHIGPHLSEHHRDVAIDLTGHGDSDHSDDYSLEDWADQVRAVAQQESQQKPVIIGHSMGGFVALTAAREFGEHLHGVAVIDSPIREMPAEAREWFHNEMQKRPLRRSDDRQELVNRFRTIPAEEGQLEFVRRNIAEQSVQKFSDGWGWKFDRSIFLRSHMSLEQVAEMSCEVALIRGERGMATLDITNDVLERLGGRAPVTLMLEAGHHIMLGQPIALIAVLQTLAGQWRNR